MRDGVKEGKLIVDRWFRDNTRHVVLAGTYDLFRWWVENKGDKRIQYHNATDERSVLGIDNWTLVYGPHYDKHPDCLKIMQRYFADRKMGRAS